MISDIHLQQRFANRVSQFSAILCHVADVLYRHPGLDPGSMRRGLDRSPPEMQIASEVAQFSDTPAAPTCAIAPLLAQRRSYVGCMVTPHPRFPRIFRSSRSPKPPSFSQRENCRRLTNGTPNAKATARWRSRADGSWYHEGGRINRPAMVKLFSTILRREADGSHVLVTPAERLVIAVEDTPFRAVEMKSEGAGEARKRRVPPRYRRSGHGWPRSSAQLRQRRRQSRSAAACARRGRQRLEARIDRALYYEIVEMALADASDPPAIWSGG